MVGRTPACQASMTPGKFVLSVRWMAMSSWVESQVYSALGWMAK